MKKNIEFKPKDKEVFLFRTSPKKKSVFEIGEPRKLKHTVRTKKYTKKQWDKKFPDQVFGQIKMIS